MKNLSISAIIEKNKLASSQAWLVAMKVHVKDPLTNNVVDEIRVVCNDEDVSIDGETYLAFPFAIDISESAGGVPTVKVTIQDQTQIVHGYMQNYGGGVGFDVDLMVVTGDDPQALSSESELVEFFKIIRSGISDYVVSWELGVENPLAVRFPRCKQEVNQCRFRYKSDECGYAGALPSCDYTLDSDNGCRAHGNAGNYGAYPGIVIRG